VHEDSEMWMAYVDYVDEMVVDGFFTTIQCSLKFLLDNTSPRPEPAALFEAVLELQAILQPTFSAFYVIFVQFLQRVAMLAPCTLLHCCTD